MARHPSVLILFAGGTTLDERPRRGVSVVTAKDVELWLAEMSEMDVIASTDGVFVHDGLSAVGMDDWATIAMKIKERYSRYDGFIVIHQAATIPAAAVALSLMVPQIGKPVVIVGSPLLSPAEVAAGWTPINLPDVSRLGAKASFINALQVAISDVGEVVVAIGHQLYRGRTFIGPLTEPGSALVGKIDFGVRFFGPVRKRQAGPLRLKPAFAGHVAILEFVPGLDIQYLARLAMSSQGIFMSVPSGVSISSAMIASLSRAAKGVPILLNGAVTGRVPANVIPLAGDRQALLIRFLWALGQTRKPAQLRTLIRQ